MWFRLASATFATNLGKMSDLSSTVRVNLDAAGFTISGAALSFDKEGSNQSRTYTLTLKSNYEIQNTVTATVNSGNATATISGGTDGVYTLVVTAATAPTSEVKVTVSGAVYVGTDLPEVPDDGGDEPTDPTPDGNNYIDITTQGTEKGSIKDSVIKIPDSSSLYLITKVQLPSNAISVEYQAFKTGGSYGSAFVNDAGTVVKFLPKTDITTGDRVTETVPSGATWFYHMYDDPNEDTQVAPTFTYIRVYTSEESSGGGSVEGLPVRITEQTQKNYGLLDVSTGTWTTQSYSDEQGGQTVTVCSIPAGATTVNYQMFKTGKTYGSGFFNGSTFISGYANNTDDAGTRKTLSIPAGATEFWHMYPNRTYANGSGNCPEFDYIEFA